MHPSFEATTDGDDYIEGNGGHDTIFGDLGQDDIVGDSSDLFGLGDNQRITLSTRVAGVTTFLKNGAAFVEWRVVGVSTDGRTLTLAGPATTVIGAQKVTIYGAGIQEPVDVAIANVTGGITLTLGAADGTWDDKGSFCLGAECRPAAGDMIFGGAGIDIGRNDRGDATIAVDGSIVDTTYGHARDADVIAGDNAQIFRIVGINGLNGTTNVGAASAIVPAQGTIAGTYGITTRNGFVQYVYDQSSAFEDRGTERIKVRGSPVPRLLIGRAGLLSAARCEAPRPVATAAPPTRSTARPATTPSTA